MLYAWHDSDMNSITGPDRPLAFTAATGDSVWHFTCGRSGLIEMRRRRHGEDSPNWPKSRPLIPDSQGGPHFKAPPGSINGPVMCLIFIQGERLRLGGENQISATFDSAKRESLQRCGGEVDMKPGRSEQQRPEYYYYYHYYSSFWSSAFIKLHVGHLCEFKNSLFIALVGNISREKQVFRRSKILFYIYTHTYMLAQLIDS